MRVSLLSMAFDRVGHKENSSLEGRGAILIWRRMCIRIIRARQLNQVQLVYPIHIVSFIIRPFSMLVLDLSRSVVFCFDSK